MASLHCCRLSLSVLFLCDDCLILVSLVSFWLVGCWFPFVPVLLVGCWFLSVSVLFVGCCFRLFVVLFFLLLLLSVDHCLILIFVCLLCVCCSVLFCCCRPPFKSNISRILKTLVFDFNHSLSLDSVSTWPHSAHCRWPQQPWAAWREGMKIEEGLMSTTATVDINGQWWMALCESWLIICTGKQPFARGRSPNCKGQTCLLNMWLIWPTNLLHFALIYTASEVMVKLFKRKLGS